MRNIGINAYITIVRNASKYK